MSDRISRCELFNRLATITAEDPNEMKAKIYAAIQEMPSGDPEGWWIVKPAPEDEWILGRYRYYCTRCGSWTSYGMPKRCPECGAVMKGRLQRAECETCVRQNEDICFDCLTKLRFMASAEGDGR